jgi:hypothetical protein
MIGNLLFANVGGRLEGAGSLGRWGRKIAPFSESAATGLASTPASDPLDRLGPLTNAIQAPTATPRPPLGDPSRSVPLGLGLHQVPLACRADERTMELVDELLQLENGEEHGDDNEEEGE